jgi:hypothetical protein
MDLHACGAMLVLASLGAAPIDDAAPPETVAIVRPAEAASVSFRFLTREEGHEILLSDVHVTIANAVEGKVLDAVSNGPYLLASLPAGRYDVAASHEGRMQYASVVVRSAEARSVSLYW